MKKQLTLVFALIILLANLAAAQQFGPWSPAVNLGAAVNTTANDQHPTISKDGLTLIFVSDRPGGFGDMDLYVSQRDSRDEPFGPPVNLAALNTPLREFAPELSTDGHWLYFHRPGECGLTDIYAAHRKDKRDDFDWEPPINLGCILNTALTDAGPTVFQDPDTGVFTMYLNRSLLPPPDMDGFDIYTSTCTADIASCNRDQLWGPAFKVDVLSVTGKRDTRTAIRRRDGLEMIVTSNRDGGCGSQDLWVSTRATTAEEWSIPVNLDADPDTGILNCSTNSSALDGAMAISWEGTELIFFSNRTGGFGGNDLYVSTREKLSGN